MRALNILFDIADSKVLDLDKSLKTTIEKELKILDGFSLGIGSDGEYYICYTKEGHKAYYAISKELYDLLKEK